jgi:hypothetical protein
MTNINAAAAHARENARHATGQFGAQEHTAPEAQLTSGPTYPHLDAVNARVHTLHDLMMDRAESAFAAAAPEGVHRIVLEDEGDGFWSVTEAQDTEGNDVTHDEDFDDVGDILTGYDGDDDKPDFLTERRDGALVWERKPDTARDGSFPDAVRDHDETAEAWRVQRERSQQVAALSIRASMPDEADTLVFEWSDQGPHLTIDGATRNGENVEVSDGDGWLIAPYEDISFASSNISDPTAAGLTDLGGGRFAVTRDTLAVSAAEGARLRTAAADAEVAAAAASAREKWDAEAAAEYARAVAELTPVID